MKAIPWTISARRASARAFERCARIANTNATRRIPVATSEVTRPTFLSAGTRARIARGRDAEPSFRPFAALGRPPARRRARVGSDARSAAASPGARRLPTMRHGWSGSRRSTPRRQASGASGHQRHLVTTHRERVRDPVGTRVELAGRCKDEHASLRHDRRVVRHREAIRWLVPPTGAGSRDR